MPTAASAPHFCQASSSVTSWVPAPAPGSSVSGSCTCTTLYVPCPSAVADLYICLAVTRGRPWFCLALTYGRTTFALPSAVADLTFALPSLVADFGSALPSLVAELTFALLSPYLQPRPDPCTHRQPTAWTAERNNATAAVGPAKLVAQGSIPWQVTVQHEPIHCMLSATCCWDGSTHKQLLADATLQMRA